MIILMLLLGRFFEWAMNFKYIQREYERITAGNIRLHTFRIFMPPFSYSDTWGSIFIPDFGIFRKQLPKIDFAEFSFLLDGARHVAN